MKKGFYIRLAGEGISKNRKLYFPYILTCICMIMMYYIVSFLSISKELASIRGGEMLQGLLLSLIHIYLKSVRIRENYTKVSKD